METTNIKTSIDLYQTEFKDYKPQGKLLDIYTYPAPILKKIAKPVTEFDENLKTLCLDMLTTMYAAPGIGLAAPQIGESLRIFVMDIDYNREKVTRADGSSDYELTQLNPYIFINPIIENKEGEILYQEGCLSVPGIYEDVKRAESIVVKFQDWEGNHHSIEAHDLFSVCIQHENDHLDGIVFLERLSMLKRNLLTKKFMKQKKKGK
ncbi:MAG: peptide deformylase [Halobacteriovoraceae bacterium]|nr:peptide deformylase [Halobacteriovoraceae bacterium]|tara:strand:- start:1630 stop:2250 length:621 start_codon:yes stop_codon:yes gene_type:complete